MSVSQYTVVPTFYKNVCRGRNASGGQDGSASHMSRGNKLIINANPSVIFSSASSPQPEQLIDILISALCAPQKV